MNDPFLAHSEITNEIYIIYGKKKYCVTDQAISAMKATGRLNVRSQGEWMNKGIYQECSECFCGCMFTISDKIMNGGLNFCPNCGAKMTKEDKHD